ncbi:unnamed protein product [Periconia digitata]|uniref:FAD-binding domain-containing protein n=1 Tax=Periconia digitata TaxID=1303443 RepID=A0A9W4U515_9PLEO|nr:unnamed protein product [Periconia digitata]
MTMAENFQVIIVGAGPVGLFLACELALAGVSVLVLERDEDPNSIWKEQPLGRRGLQPSAIESFYRRGLLEKITPAFEDVGLEHMKSFKETFAGHFAGIMLYRDKINPKQHPYHLDGPAYVPLVLTLQILDTALTAHAESLGVKIIRNAEITALDNGEDSVKVTTASGKWFSSSYLVGCDGGKSFIRKAASIPFPGTGPEFTGYTGIATLDRPELIKPGLNHTPNGLTVYPSPNNYSFIEFDLSFDRSQPVTREHFETALQRTTQTDVKVIELKVAGTYTARCKQAANYRKNRVLLAGDAAHIHSPLGGQGLNAGIGDAMNLGWKLAAVAHGRAKEGLLDSYHAERYPVGKDVLDWTRAQVATLRPDGCAKAVQRVMKGLADTVDGTTWLVGKIWGIETKYAGFGVEEDEAVEVHDLVGRSAPDFMFEGGKRLGEKLVGVGSKFVVLDLKGDKEISGVVEALEAGDLVGYVGGRVEESFGARCMILRPDGFVAWVATLKEQITLGDVRRALERWITL